MACHAAVGINDDLSTGQPTVADGPADDELAGGVYENTGIFRQSVARDHRLDDLLHHRFMQVLLRHVWIVLSR